MSISSINSLSAGAGFSGGPGLSQPVSADQRALLQAVRTVNVAELLGPDTRLTYVRDSTTQQPVIRIVDKDSGDVVAQIPAEDVLRLADEFNGA
jgi:uncharacterized FlaG/YvyC family protein